MGIFDKLFGSKAKETVSPKCVAPVNGTVKTLESLGDGMFSEKILGDGIVVEPADGNFVAPVAGTLATVFPTGHAYGITGDNGAEILLHIGIDTVEMDGKGFTILVKEGQHVAAGTPIAKVDLEAVKAAGHPASAIVIITNEKAFALQAQPGTEVKAGEDLLEIV